jgi:hypothetical protein
VLVHVTKATARCHVQVSAALHHADIACAAALIFLLRLLLPLAQLLCVAGSSDYCALLLIGALLQDESVVDSKEAMLSLLLLLLLLDKCSTCVHCWHLLIIAYCCCLASLPAGRERG